MDVKETLVSVEDVLAARERLAGTIIRTPCVRVGWLSELTGAEVFCKLEFLQRTGSFKERGARNALAGLVERGLVGEGGVVAASAGNHALGLAWHGKLLGVAVTVVMPRGAPEVKVRRCRELGANVVLAGETFEEARGHAEALVERRGLKYVHPFDDVDVIAGQGTVGLEVFEQVARVDAVVVPVGGGGLLAGVSVAAPAGVEVVGVEPEGASCFEGALRAGEAVRVETRPTLADGLAVAVAGEKTLRVARGRVSKVVSVGEGEIGGAMVRLREKGWTVEGAGAVGVAALLGGKLGDVRGKRVAVLLTGGNVDGGVFRRLMGEEEVRRNAAPTAG